MAALSYGGPSPSVRTVSRFLLDVLTTCGLVSTRPTDNNIYEVSIHTAGRVYRFSLYMHTANYLTISYLLDINNIRFQVFQIIFRRDGGHFLIENLDKLLRI